ncbi:RidA family protein [Psychroflexus sp. MES1-P1E]|uniref:RidA family protein n=1 Tax=Psychroflexus sp. MES1-P1E TaxID=2058320 RepID=UPI0027E44E61|nr:RidA family protein [Psychroflexus sp. MES1-P1E]
MKTLKLQVIAFLSILMFSTISCIEKNEQQTEDTSLEKAETALTYKSEYFQLKPEIEEAYGYSHAVKIGNHIKISGAVSMNDEGNPKAVGDLAQQMKNCYADLEKILTHYGYTFDDVVKEDVFTTDMSLFWNTLPTELKFIKTISQLARGWV